MITERHVQQERGIPILMDIPVIGYLFKSTLESTELATLLFFIRPRVLEGTDLLQEF
jgi:type II secretory pathway component GspD/PulD (secretin)